MIRKESCKCVGINVWRKSGSREKEGEEQKRVVPPEPQKREFQSFRVLKFRVLEECFWFHIANIISSSSKKRTEGFWGVFEYSIRAKNNTRQKRSSSRDTISFLLSLSLSLFFFFFFFSGFFGCNNNTNQQKELLLRLFLCYVMWC